MSETKETFNFDYSDWLPTLWKWRKKIITITLISGILGGLIAFIIPPQYKAEVEFYPTTINSIGNAFFTDLNKREADVLAFGEEEEAENALQLLQSSKLIGRVVKNFKLFEHYGIDVQSSKPKYKLANKIKKNIKFKRTRGLSVKISVYDKDPVMAAKIANGIAAIYDTVKSEIQHEVALQALEVVQSEYQNKEREVEDLRKNLKSLANKGVTNFEEQARAISEEIYKARSIGKINRAKELEEEQKELAKYAGEFTYFNETLILESEVLVQLRKRLKKAQVDVNKTITHKFILTDADVPEVRAKPKRKLLVLVVCLSTMFFTSLLILMRENLKTIDFSL
ncbi:MAG: hypothetical protein CNE98_00525 [Bacteroidetes bacterium MED-G17]|nr:MAG: hypothetical protein CBB99_06020 [Bacteroidetes bacterium TMED39]PDH53576.1 MAG: hypothetical protein CNE98_00525 [Bacteroidetes bacterium MED-G17]CAI8336921.1 MAG: Uncharacterised protein [Bacteroidetes bacterium MED-G17]|tara:strand:+ start:3472 stop:4488 length:1017 start_codon:yes stop_codon:yes gene_type:complete